MNPIIQDLFTQIKELYPQQELVEFHQKFKEDDEFQKIIMQTKSTKSLFESTDDRSTLIDQLRNIINETKIAHKQSLLSAKQFEIASSEKQQVFNENTQLKNEIISMENYNYAQKIELSYFQELYNIIIEEEQQKKIDFFGAISKEFQEIQIQLEQVSNVKRKNQIENEELKEKLKIKQQQFEKRRQHCDESIMKLEQDRKERFIKIFQEINFINQNFNDDEEQSDQLEKLKKEEALIDLHLNPYLQKDYEYTQLIEKSNKLFSLYNTEVKKLLQQCEDNQKKSLKNQTISEKSDIFIVEQVKEYQGLLKILKQKQEQKLQLENLKSSQLNKLF
ncbi:unnamed protein product [Paramecium pentaurelia]|uniref:Uncharacterized protein n=1 Tax=Paramecium pentaurelia TaxID=43138 RepID=A0A8S1ULE2_9CILI|nr:unnamed protein product [Paramecium pentaurelia]